MLPSVWLKGERGIEFPRLDGEQTDLAIWKLASTLTSAESCTVLKCNSNNYLLFAVWAK